MVVAVVTVLCVWFAAQLAKSLTSCDLLLGLLAAATHDLDHPGVNQPFLIKTSHYLATLYKVKAHTRGSQPCHLVERGSLPQRCANSDGARKTVGCVENQQRTSREPAAGTFLTGSLLLNPALFTADCSFWFILPPPSPNPFFV